MSNELNEYEKIRLRLKIMWEGGLSGYIDYGVASVLYNKFKKEFDEIDDSYKKSNNKLIKNLEKQIEIYLGGNIKSMNMWSIDTKKYNDIDFNDYNYILK